MSNKGSAGAAVEEAPLPHSLRRITRLLEALGGRRYLEIGVKGGKTFLPVRAAEKVAVDPAFTFRPDPKPGETFHPITSDVFFTRHARGAFDVIFLDGLHTFEQTFRDFCASHAHAHPGTVWLIDDTLPIDVYSSHRDQKKAVDLRAAAGGKGGAWHGDVYKIVFAIADFFPTFSFATMRRPGNPQTLVWREPRTAFRPVFDSLEAISRLDWFELQDRLDVLNIMAEDDALARAIAGAKAAAVAAR